jgi:hypothetical protein
VELEEEDERELGIWSELQPHLVCVIYPVIEIDVRSIGVYDE